jgi:formate dehydrogenase accessory protein FdhD
METDIQNSIQKIGAFLATIPKGSEGTPPPSKAELHCVIYLNGKIAGDTGCTPLDVDKLALGWLAASGLSHLGEVSQLSAKLVHSMLHKSNNYTSAPFIRVDVEAPNIRQRRFRMRPRKAGEAARAALDMLDLSKTGLAESGLFVCGISDGHTCIYHEDICLRNAFFKTLGTLVSAEMDPRHCAAALGGSVTGEFVECTVNAGISVLISRFSPTSSAIMTARGRGIWLYTDDSSTRWRYA